MSQPCISCQMLVYTIANILVYILPHSSISWILQEYVPEQNIITFTVESDYNKEFLSGFARGRTSAIQAMTNAAFAALVRACIALVLPLANQRNFSYDYYSIMDWKRCELLPFERVK